MTQKVIKNSLSKLFMLSGSQIWLIPLVDDHRCGYITKLKKKNLVGSDMLILVWKYCKHPSFFFVVKFQIVASFKTFG